MLKTNNKRNKFKKRNKRDNSITEGCYVLAGIREWEVVAPKKKQKADLSEVDEDDKPIRVISDLEACKKHLRENEIRGI